MRALVAMVLLLSIGVGSAHAVEPVDLDVRSRPTHVALDAAFTYGIGGWSALGVQLHPTVGWSLWSTRRATGTIDLGVVLGYQNEPQAIQAIAARGQESQTHRLNAFATVGTTFHLGRLRRSGLGLHLFGGWTHVWSSATIRRPDLSFDGTARDDYGVPNVGVILRYAYRVHRNLGLSLQAAAPFQTTPSYVATLFHVGIGLTGYFR